MKPSPSAMSAALLALAATAPAMESHIVGPRALGMGGTGTAAVDDHTSAYWNPAMQGFYGRTGEDGARLAADPNHLGRKDWGLGLADATVQVEVRGELADWVERLSELDLDRLASLGSGGGSPDDLVAAMTALDLVNRFTPSRDAVTVVANAGVLNLRVLNIGLGLRQYVEGVVSVADLDRINLGFGTDTITAVVTDINTATPPSGYTSAHVPTLITGADAAALATALGGGMVADEAVRRLDYAAGAAGLTQAQVAALINGGDGLLLDAINASGFNAATSFENNRTAVFTGGYALTEVPLSLGWPVNDYLAVGGAIKLLVGRVAGAKVRLLGDTGSVADLLRDGFENAEQTVTGGLDLSVAARWSWGRVGLTGRNLNRPVLKGGTFRDGDGQPFTVADVPLDPQARLGIALHPWTTLTLSADLDLTENRTEIRTVSGRSDQGTLDPVSRVTFANRQAAAGVEWNLLRVLALRGGLSKDLAESDAPAMIHLGLGLDLWLLRLDLGGAIATERVVVDDTDMPRSFAFSGGLAIDF